MGSPFVVLLAKPEQLKAAEVSSILAAFRKIPFQDAARLARKAWGFLAEDLEEGQAEELEALARKAGLETLRLPKEQVAGLPESTDLAQAELEDKALEAILRSGDRESISWDRLALIAGAAYTQSTSKLVETREGPSMAQKAASLGLKMATGLPISIGGKERKVVVRREETELCFTADIILRSPDRRLRIDGQHFNYAGLRERMAYGVLPNFKTLIVELARRAPGAWKSRGSRALETGTSLATIGYDSLDDLERESRWLLSLIRYRSVAGQSKDL